MMTRMILLFDIGNTHTHLGLANGERVVKQMNIATASWMAAERTYRRRPERLTAMMVAAFGVKMVFFGAYVAIALKVLSLRPIPFVISFTGYFIGLHVIEALYLRRLFAGGTA